MLTSWADPLFFTPTLGGTISARPAVLDLADAGPRIGEFGGNDDERGEGRGGESGGSYSMICRPAESDMATVDAWVGRLSSPLRSGLDSRPLTPTPHVLCRALPIVHVLADQIGSERI